MKMPRLVTSTVATLLIIGLPAAGTASAEVFKPNILPSLEISRSVGSIAVDGYLSDDGWRGSAVATNFCEETPGDQTEPPVATEALITFDESHLYVGIICYDDPTSIRASFCERDNIYSDDFVVLLIDTYGEAVWTYSFEVNPYGIQGDASWSANGGEDYSYDMIWESVGKITDSGYQVEIAIPFSSLRFPNRTDQVWRLDFYRNHPRETLRGYSWAARDRNQSCSPCQWGTVSGIQISKRTYGIELLPSVIGFQSGALVSANNPNSVFENDDPDGELSLGAKYAVSSDVILEATYNPDFSQVEADAAQIDVNTTFALFYPERRPFFQEGSELFYTWFSAVYTRSINAPEFAGKFTGRFNRTSMAFLSARDEYSPIILPSEERSDFLLAGKSTSNIFRLRQTFGEDTQMGLIFTDRRLDDGGSGTLYGADGNVRLAKHYRVQWAAFGSYTSEPDDSSLTFNPFDTVFHYTTFDDDKYTMGFNGESFSGYAWVVNLEERSRHVDFDISYRESSPTFRADNGLEPRNNWKRVDAFAAYNFYSIGSFVDAFYPYVQVLGLWNFDGTLKERSITFSLDADVKGQTNIHPSIRLGEERMADIDFKDIWLAHLCVHSKFSDRLGLSGSINYGHQVARHYLVKGQQLSLRASAEIKPVNQFLIEPELNFSRSEDLDTGEELFEGHIFRTRLNYQFTRELSLRLVVQYDDFYQTWDIDPLITYKISPFSVFYAGSTYDYCRFDGLGSDGADTRTRLASRQFFLKLQYLFRI
ncbi:MAG: carbohydrate binding family 9 domain-containing protein [Candidatus Zixiibacteriota bacterium]|nr:MAG: carbohydrate binding family 9 domain-containing protein [candidate division Zixibacteria bacterium]